MFFEFFLLVFLSIYDTKQLFGIELKEKTSRENFTDTKWLFIYDSSFINFNLRPQANDNSGGAICGSRKGIKLAIDRCVFEDCSSQGCGGAIFLRTTGTGSSRICCVIAHHCESLEKKGNFAYLFTEGFNENFLNLTAISFSGHGLNAKGSSPTFMQGSSNVGYLNTSMNDCFMNSGFESKINSLILFSIFIDNAATNAHCLLFEGTGHIKSCNIMKNFQLNTVSGLITVINGGDFAIVDCYISDNSNGKTVEYGNARLEIKNCYIDKFSCDNDFEFDQSDLKENQITFFHNNSDILTRIRSIPPKKPPKQQQPHHNHNQHDKHSSKRKLIKHVAMFILLFISVFCAGLTAIFQTYDDEINEEEPLLKGKKKKNLSAMNAIV